MSTPAERPTLTTDRLVLRKFTGADISQHYVGWLNDPEIVRFSENRHVQHTPRSCREYVLSFENSENILWGIWLRGEAKSHIGNIAAYIDTVNRVADVSILLGEKGLWGQGLGREAFSRVCSYLLDTAGMRKVTAGTMAENKSMLAVMRDVGMIEEGRRLRQFLFEGREVDMVYGALFARESF